MIKETAGIFSPGQAGRSEVVGVPRNSPETDPHPPPSSVATAAAAPSTRGKAPLLKEVKSIEPEVAQTGICTNAAAQPNAAQHQDSIEISARRDTPVEINEYPNKVYCKIAEVEVKRNPGITTANEQNDSEGSWVNKIPSTVILGSDGNTVVLSGNANGVSVSRFTREMKLTKLRPRLKNRPLSLLMIK